jgi:hypothetical protein
MDKSVSLHLNIIQRVAFFLLRTMLSFQRTLSIVFWFFTGKWTVYLLGKLIGEKRDDGATEIEFSPNEKCSSFAKPLAWTINVNAYLSGIKHSFYSHEMLLKWTPSIPLIALTEEKANYDVKWLGEKRQENGEELQKILGWHSFGESKVQGYFKIIDKYFVQTDNGSTSSPVHIACVWLSGEDAGKYFEINMPGYSQRKGLTRVRLPHHIYFPPKVMNWALDAVVSIGLTSIIVAAVYHSALFVLGV